LTDWEVASRLSFFIWSSMPDETLLDAARDGALTRASGCNVNPTSDLDENASSSIGLISSFRIARPEDNTGCTIRICPQNWSSVKPPNEGRVRSCEERGPSPELFQK